MRQSLDVKEFVAIGQYFNKVTLIIVLKGIDLNIFVKTNMGVLLPFWLDPPKTASE